VTTVTIMITAVTTAGRLGRRLITDEGHLCSGQLSASDVDSAALSYSIMDGPAHACWR